MKQKARVFSITSATKEIIISMSFFFSQVKYFLYTSCLLSESCEQALTETIIKCFITNLNYHKTQQ